MSFPKDFTWGTASSSYQIEGAAQEDGRGECIWTRFSHTPGNVSNNETGDVACDHYHLYQHDVALMKAIGLDAYRFSVSWPRVLPTGAGEQNQAGLDFYSRLVDALLEAGITPYVTLYHWDLPQALQQDGEGWENPAIVEKFADYAALMAETLGDRVHNWITHNEPWVASFVGNWQGRHAPGKQDLSAAYRAAHHILLSHGEAVKRLRGMLPDHHQIGITLDYADMHAASNGDEDTKIAHLNDGFKNRWFLDAVFKGTYPADVVEHVRGVDGALEDIDLDAVQLAAQPIDFLGLNYYTRNVFEADGSMLGRTVERGDEHTAMDWEVYPDGLYNMLTRVYQDYNPKVLYITENGAAFDDPAPENGTVEDPQRQAYLESHFAAAERALTEGVPLRGYFVWSLMDNFEWAEGYDKRFGIIYIDYETHERTLKNSALYYRDKIAATR